MAASHYETGTHHCAIFPSDEHGANHKSFINCKLHPGHKEFMTVDECLNKKPSEIGLDDGDDMSAVRTLIDRTVRVVVYHVSTDRPDTFINSKTAYPCTEKRGSYNHIRCGTGFLFRRYLLDVKELDLCPCPECETSSCQMPNRKSHYFVVQTATHVIFDKWEAQKAVFEFFYDSEDSSYVKKVYGINVLDCDLLRLQTDKCFVVGVTHDSSLAEKLGFLCDKDAPWIRHVLVSHPHGVSKKISVADDPDPTYLIILNKTSVKLKKGKKICFPGCHDAACFVQDINRLLDKLVIVNNDLTNTFILHCDLTVCRPEGIVVDVDYHDTYGNNEVWCDVFQPGTLLSLSDNENTYTFPYKDDNVPVVRMKVFEKIKYFLDNDDKDEHSVFVYTRFNMASCPGSSGACVDSFRDYFYGIIPGHVLFGNCGDYNTSSLFCIHSPGGELESETNTMDPWRESEYNKYKQFHYDRITGK